MGLRGAEITDVTFMPLVVATPMTVSIPILVAWNAVPDPLVIGYQVYYGPAHLTYTGPGSPVDAGNVLDVVIFVPPGWTYIAITSYTSTEVSAFSGEAIV